MTTLCVCRVKPNKPLQFYDSKAIKIMSIFSRCNDNRFFVLSPAQMPFVIFMVRTFSVGCHIDKTHEKSVLNNEMRRKVLNAFMHKTANDENERVHN